MKDFQNIFIILIVAAFFSCKKYERFSTENDKVPPGKVTITSTKPILGGARFFYQIPDDEDILGVEATYTNDSGKIFKFMSSFLIDSLDVFGFPDENEHLVKLYAVDRSGNRSEPVEMSVKGLEPAYLGVAKSVKILPGFSSFFVDWSNPLEQNVTVFVDYEFKDQSGDRSLTTVFSSNLETDRRAISDLKLDPSVKIKIKVSVGDIYGNKTEPIDQGEINLFEDIQIPKDKWVLPEPNDSIGGVPMGFGNGLEGRTAKVIDGLIDRGDNLNFMHTHSRGRTGKTADGNMPWNVMIDLGDKYEISRIITVQRHSGGLANINRGQYYQSENVGIYNIYIWDESNSQWEFVTQHKIPVPQGLTELQYVQAGEAGDMAYMFPDDPQYTKPTRWVRYEAVKSFNGNYTLEDANCLSEITLFGRKAK